MSPNPPPHRPPPPPTHPPVGRTVPLATRRSPKKDRRRQHTMRRPTRGGGEAKATRGAHFSGSLGALLSVSQPPRPRGTAHSVSTPTAPVRADPLQAFSWGNKSSRPTLPVAPARSLFVFRCGEQGEKRDAVENCLGRFFHIAAKLL